jgi:hypothetical protein
MVPCPRRHNEAEMVTVLLLAIQMGAAWVLLAEGVRLAEGVLLAEGVRPAEEQHPE